MPTQWIDTGGNTMKSSKIPLRGAAHPTTLLRLRSKR